ncbi:hypothetical protein ACUW9D_001680 [Staphylococcus epidermidis]|uniref:TscA family type II toxin-antitoxin system antitoxin n=1 Tax=Staphylococcus epidermidis TaxID=1282 RepID=UPI001931AD70|nr:hypothetical protein [Staphylococcus epidermidis]MBM0778331.1 hypothetical protein [Staphylococcus epidermidis]
MDNDQLKVIKEVYEIIESSINDERREYVHKVSDGSEEWDETYNREEQLQFICELVMPQIENNFEWED